MNTHRSSRFISLRPGLKPYRVLIERRGFRRSMQFATLTEAEDWRDEQVKQMPPSAREKQPAPTTPATP